MRVCVRARMDLCVGVHVRMRTCGQHSPMQSLTLLLLSSSQRTAAKIQLCKDEQKNSKQMLDTTQRAPIPLPLRTTSPSRASSSDFSDPSVSKLKSPKTLAKEVSDFE